MSEIRIRRASLEDIDQMVELGAEMHRESSYKQYSFDRRRTENTLVGIIEDRLGIPLVAEKDGVILGGIVGGVSQHYFGLDMVASELALFITKDERKGRLALKILLAFIDEAKELGADQIAIGNSTGVEIERVKAIYERMGFKHVGFVFHMGCK